MEKASARLGNVQELLKNTIFIQQQIKYEQSRRFEVSDYIFSSTKFFYSFSFCFVSSFFFCSWNFDSLVNASQTHTQPPKSSIFSKSRKG